MSKAQRENLQHTLSRWWRDFICCCLGKNCCGGEFFAGKAGFFATQVGRSTWLHISFLRLCKGCFKSQSGMLTRMSFLLVLITGGTDRPRVPQQPSHYPPAYGSRTWCDELWNVQCFFVLWNVFRKQYSFPSAVLCMQFFCSYDCLSWRKCNLVLFSMLCGFRTVILKFSWVFCCDHWMNLVKLECGNFLKKLFSFLVFLELVGF